MIVATTNVDVRYVVGKRFQCRCLANAGQERAARVRRADRSSVFPSDSGINLK